MSDVSLKELADRMAEAMVSDIDNKVLENLLEELGADLEE